MHTSKTSATLKVVIFTDNTGEVLSPDLVSTDRVDICIGLRKCDWHYLDDLKIGDVIERIDFGKQKFAVNAVVDDFLIGKIVRARSVD